MTQGPTSQPETSDNAAPRRDNSADPRCDSSAPPRYIAHRGLSARAPENTLAAVQAAHDAGCEWVELDVQLLGDGTPVIWHDAGIKRCSDGRGKLFKLDAASAATLDVGSWFGDQYRGERMATLEAMLTLIQRLGMGLNLELKVSRGRNAIELVKAALPPTLEALPPERLIVSSFDRHALTAARALESDPERLRLGVLDDKAPKRWWQETERLSAYSLHLDWRKLKIKRAREIADESIKLFCYTANDPVTFEKLWDWGVDGVISDDPTRFVMHAAEQRSRA
ncbi:glycerophosphoryl diester phosphodiesterase [Salinicola rhizosphaerae]|uniref:Glycerophosphoryl diester phosphodiesterase n=1 Tax=Salinicola rhizosphaerae TaxID=1443141 RepID=A0ABQ3E9H3_9GAMM|nr:glycerophosphoryl diester phosphodiesterase [Salinicola rhizosphaerae]GHB26990.1 glycerophosphoryl diester phosphodiesterase [Salinicola rhizosphaerae]